MNFRLDVVLNDIINVSGQTIIKAIITDETCPESLAALASNRVKKSKEKIATALSYNGCKDYFFELTDCFEMYHVYSMPAAEKL